MKPSRGWTRREWLWTAAGALTFAPGETEQNLEIIILQDGAVEGNETITLTLSNPNNVTLGAQSSTTLTINDDDSGPNVQFANATLIRTEDAGVVQLQVNLSAAVANPVTVNYATSGTATVGQDYTISGNVLTFAVGETQKSVNLTILDDSVVEGNETVTVTLSNPTNAVLGATVSTTVTIQDNDSASQQLLYLPIITR